MADSNPFGFTASSFSSLSSTPFSSSSVNSSTMSSKFPRTKRHFQKRKTYVRIDTAASNGCSVPTFTTSFVYPSGSCFSMGSASSIFASKSVPTLFAGLSTSPLSTDTAIPVVTTTAQTSKLPKLSMPNENSGGDTNVNQQLENGESANPTEDVTVIKEEKDDVEHESLTAPTVSIVPISRILAGLPQNPHFLQLRSFSEIVRRNLISGWDRTFEDTVEQIHALRKEDFWARASELWKTMEGLQSVGYSVVRLRRRIVEMSDLMMELKQFELEINRLKEKAEMHRMEKTRLESVILCVRARADKEQGNMAQTLCQADKMQQDLPRYDGFLAKLAMESLAV